MSRRRTIAWGLRAAALLCAAAQLGATALNRNEQRVRDMSAAMRKKLSALKTLRRQSLDDIARDTNAAVIERRTREVLALGSLCVASRTTDANGRAPVFYYIRRHIDDLRGAGLEYLGSIKGQVAVPVSLDRLGDRDGRGPAARITVGQRSWPVTPLWANGAMPSLCPKGGLTGPLVFAGAAGWDDLKGLDLSGAIALMRFEGGLNIHRLFALGCQAVIVVEDDYVMREKAEELACSSPLPMPRFYVDANTGAALTELAARKDYRVGAADGAVIGGQTCRLEGGNLYAERPFESPFAYLPPTPPVRYEVRGDDLIDRIATDHGVSVEDLMAENRLTAPDLEGGMELAIPGKTAVYKVKPGDLLNRVAAQFGLDARAIQKANKLPSAELAAGQVLTIPNLDDVMVVLVPVDSVSVAPDAPHGAKTAANIAIALTAMEHLARDTTVPRRKGVLLGFLDAEAVGGMTSRTFAEYVLRRRGELTGVGVIERHFSTAAVVVGVLLGLAVGALAGLLRARGRGATGGRRMLHVGVTAACVGVGGFLFTFFPQWLGGYAGDVTIASAEKCQAGLSFLSDPSKAAGDDANSQWLAQNWLMARVEERRIWAAEQRIDADRRRREAKGKLAELPAGQAGDGERAALGRDERSAAGDVARFQSHIDFAVKLRDGTVQNRKLPWPKRVEAFCRQLAQAERDGVAGRIGLTLAALRERMGVELAQERRRREFTGNNLQTVGRVLARLDAAQAGKTAGDAGKADFRPSFGYLLDFSSGGQVVGFKRATGFRGLSAPASAKGEVTSSELELSATQAAAYAALQANWPEEWTIWHESDQVDHPLLRVGDAAVYPEFWAASGVVANIFGTLGDVQEMLDTPHDLPQRTGFARLSVQARSALLLLKLGLESHSYSQPATRITVPKYGKLIGQALQFNIRSGIDAQDPVPGVTVYFPGFKSKLGEAGGKNTLSYNGSRRGMVQISLLNGSYEMPLMCLNFPGKWVVHGYRLDRDKALFDKVVDMGQVGTQKKTPDFKLLDRQTVKKNLIMARDLYPLVLFPGPDPMDYKAVGSADDKQDVNIIDADRQGEPQHFAYVNPANDYHEVGVEGNMVFLPPGRRVRLMVRKTMTYKMLLVGDVTARQPKGAGHVVGPVGDRRNLAVPVTALQIAREMHALARYRQDVYRSYGITDRSVGAALDRSAEKIAVAEAAVKRRDWQAAFGAAREGWGILIKFYPRILKLGREAVFSAVILMALLVPASAFLEKLLVGGKSILRHLAGATAFFVAGVVFLNFFHPAFRISVSPFIVMIAFTMILMALIVLTISYQRFDVLVRRARAAVGEVEGEEISFASSLATALSLGVSNLKKRPVRTALTCFTVTVLTFSIITFVSVRGRDAIERRPVALDDTAGIETVEPLAPAYEGILFRDTSWRALPDTFVSAVYSEFGSRFELTTRGHYIQVEGGNNADREGVNQLKVNRGRRQVVLTGVMAFEPAEERFSRLDRAVSHRHWFRGPDRAARRGGDRHVTILPDDAARQLGIREAMLYDLRLRVADVADWTALCRALNEPNCPAATRLAERLGPARELARRGAAAELDATRKADLLAAVNALLPAADLFAPDQRLAVAGAGYLEAADAAAPDSPRELVKDLTAEDQVWLNGLIVERILAGALAERRDVLRPGDKLPVVVFMNVPWRVVGILDTALADRVRDITGKTLAMVDYLRSGMSVNSAAGDLINEPTSYHLSWSRLVIVPMAAAADVQIKPRSVAVRFEAGQDRREFFQDLALRLNRTIFANDGGRLSLMTTQEKQSVAGLAKIIVPVILCILIVWNTMMANVEERKGEVGMLGSVGLSPRQISFLLLSESAVFSVLGIVLGIFAGLLFSNGVAWANARWYSAAQLDAGAGFLSELSFNFTSLSSLALAMGTGLVVLLATLVPARKAAALAAPSGMAKWELPPPAGEGLIRFDLPFTLTRGNAVGMGAFFRRFLLNHTDAASSDFNCRDVRAGVRGDGQQALAITAQMWLAPYDLDVAQNLEVCIVPTDNEGVFGVVLDLRRTSGTEEAWLRTNYNFMDLVRYQFLLWRNLDHASRDKYVAEGAAVFQEGGC